MTELILKLKENNLIDEMGNIIIEKTDTQTMCVDVETFNTFFGDKPFTYDDMVGEHSFIWNGETMTVSCESLGYTKYFDKWLELGIIE